MPEKARKSPSLRTDSWVRGFKNALEPVGKLICIESPQGKHQDINLSKPTNCVEVEL